MTKNSGFEHGDNTELCEQPDMFKGKTWCVMNSVRKTGNNKNMRCDAQRNSIQDKPLSAANVRTTERAPLCAVNVNNHKYCKLKIMQQDLSSIGSEISKAFSIISNDFQNCTSVIELREKNYLMQSLEEK